MNKIKIRKADKKDAKLILELITELAIYEKLENEVVATESDIIKEIFENNSAIVFIAEFNAKPVAYSLHFYTFSTFLAKKGIYLEDLFVLNEYRGKGIGKQLLKNIALDAVKNGFGRVEWSVLNWNSTAIDFYKSIGAIPQDEWTMYRLTGENLQKFANK
jgi:GNAT superfamily N-acetyltransferase